MDRSAAQRRAQDIKLVTIQPSAIDNRLFRSYKDVAGINGMNGIKDKVLFYPDFIPFIPARSLQTAGVLLKVGEMS